MTYYDQFSSGYGAWYLTYNYGLISIPRIIDAYVIRPVFYLNKNVYITNPNATGSSTDPFILAY